MVVPEMEMNVDHKMGLHAHPAALFAQTAKQFACDLRAAHDILTKYDAMRQMRRMLSAC